MGYNKISKIRKEKGMTLTKLADLSGISVGYLCTGKWNKKKSIIRKNGKNSKSIGKNNYRNIFQIESNNLNKRTIKFNGKI